MYCIDDEAYQIRAQTVRFGCGKVFFLKPVLVSFVLAKFHAACHEMQFSFDVRRDATLQEAATRTCLQQLPYTIECWQQCLWICQNIFPQLLKFGYASDVLQ